MPSTATNASIAAIMPSFGGPPATDVGVGTAAGAGVAPAAAEAAEVRGGLVALDAAGAGFAGAATDGAGAELGGIDAAGAGAETGAGSAGRVVPHWTQNLAPGCVS